jgi:AraC family transcriptional regulator
MRSATADLYQERILNVLLHLREHLDEDVSLETLARVAHFSPFHFHRIFRGMVGESVKEHVRRLRLERAAVRLRRTRAPVTQLAFEAGFESHEAFTRAFRAMFGDSPSAYRRSAVLHLPGGSELKTGETAMQAQIKTVDPMEVVFVRHVGPYQTCQPAWDKLCAWAATHPMFGPGTRALGVSHDDPDVTPPEKLRYDACLTVSQPVQPEGEVGVMTIGGGRYATTVHRGPFEGLTQTYAELCGQWVPQNGHEIRSAPCFEIYLNDPKTTPPEELLTEIYVPVES